MDENNVNCDPIIMRNESIDHIKQQGPTCGIYAIVMIINSIKKRSKLDGIDGQDIALSIFDIATDDRNGISQIGELFTEKSVIELIQLINKSGLFDITLTSSIINFSSPEDLKNKLVGGFNNNQYFLFPYDKHYGNNNKKTRVLHWGVLSHFEEKYIIGQQGNVKSGEKFCNYDNDSSVIKASLDDLYNANQSMDDCFEWGKYFSLKKRILRFTDNLLYSVNRKMDRKISRITRNKLSKLREETVSIDLKGKMIMIGYR